MSSSTFEPLFKAWQPDCELLGLDWDEQKLALLVRFYDQLMQVNAHTNLTRIETPEDFLYKHVLDSLHLSKFIPEGAYVADVGSGGGFPAFPLVIYRPDVRLVAIESVGKKAAFIQETAKVLGLTNLTVLNERCENLGQSKAYRSKFDRVTARAVAPLRVLLELTIPLLNDKTQIEPGVPAELLALKGSKFPEELEEAQNAMKLLCTQLENAYINPIERLSHSVVGVFEKRKPIPNLYPRDVGIPKKSPL